MACGVCAIIPNYPPEKVDVKFDFRTAIVAPMPKSKPVARRAD